MKKTYYKPALSVESFSLSQSIAGACGGVTHEGNDWGRPAHATKSTCGWDVGGITVWVTAPSCKDIQQGPDVPYEGICYNNPAGNLVAFGS